MYKGDYILTKSLPRLVHYSKFTIQAQRPINPRKILKILLILSSAAGINSSSFPNVKALP